MADEMWVQAFYTCGAVITIIIVSVSGILWTVRGDRPNKKDDCYPTGMTFQDIIILHKEKIEYVEKQLDGVQKQINKISSYLLYLERVAKGIHKDCDSTKGCVHRVDTNKE